MNETRDKKGSAQAKSGRKFQICDRAVFLAFIFAPTGNGFSFFHTATRSPIGATRVSHKVGYHKISKSTSGFGQKITRLVLSNANINFSGYEI